MSPKPAEISPSLGSRDEAIDQFRGYAVFGMILVNYLGEFESVTEWFKHHREYMSYADTIAPLFLFVSGMGAAGALRRRIGREGPVRGHLAMGRRYAVLILIGIALYGPMEWRYWWDALVDIGFAGLLALPFLLRGPMVRTAVAAGYAGLYQWLYSCTGYGEWTMASSIDGGPLGPLSWAFMFIAGSVFLEWINALTDARLLRNAVVAGAMLCAAGWIAHIPWGSLKTEWDFSQYAMTLPYVLMATGLCIWTYLPFHFLCRKTRWRIPNLSVLGLNALVVYMVDIALGDLHGPFIVPGDSGPWMAILGFVAFYLACYAVAWRLARDRIVIKL